MKALPAFRPALVPAPLSCIVLDGVCDLGRGYSVRNPPQFATAATALAGRFRKSGRPEGGDSAISIAFIEDVDIRHGEGYRLDASPDRIEIRASGAAGAFYAAQSVIQMELSGDGRIPCCRIEDAPRFSWRGFMLDTCRHFFRVEFILRMLDLAALHKLNRFHWHLTEDQAWRLDLVGHPELAGHGAFRLDRRFDVPVRMGGSYSVDDVRRVVSHAASLHITVIPEIETPGHAIALLASHPELACVRSGTAADVGSATDGIAADGIATDGIAATGFEPEDRYGIFEDVLCAGNDAVFDLLGDVYDEVIALFPGPWVHSGGDEVPKTRWLSCPRCLERMRKQGLVNPEGDPDPEALQGWFMGRVGQLLTGRGKRMIGWDELLEGEVGKDAVIMSWRGTCGGREAALAGHDVIMCPQTKACYLDHKHLDLPEEPGQLGVCTVRDSYMFEPEPAGLPAQARARILGGQANLWTELMYFGRQVEYMAFPRLCALSEVFWSPKESRDFEDFALRLENQHGRRLDILGVNRYRGPLY